MVFIRSIIAVEYSITNQRFVYDITIATMPGMYQCVSWEKQGTALGGQ